MQNHHYSVTAALRSTLVDPDKVLKALNDRAERDLDKLIGTFGTDAHRNHDLRERLSGLDEASQLIWEVMRDAYSQGPDYEFPETNRRRELRQALRTMNLGARAVTALLKASAVEFEKHTYQNAPSYRLEFAKRALGIAETFANKCLPGPKTYNHPQFSKWLKLCAQSKRRIGALYLDDARVSEEKAAQGPSSEQCSFGSAKH